MAIAHFSLLRMLQTVLLFPSFFQLFIFFFLPIVNLLQLKIRSNANLRPCLTILRQQVIVCLVSS